MDKMFGNLGKFKNRVALVNINDQVFTYNDILKISYKINSNIEKEAVILIIVSNNAESIIGYVSFIRSQNLSIFYHILYKFYKNYVVFYQILSKNIKNIRFSYMSTWHLLSS